MNQARAYRERGLLERLWGIALLIAAFLLALRNLQTMAATCSNRSVLLLMSEDPYQVGLLMGLLIYQIFLLLLNYLLYRWGRRLLS
ncbi:MAG: hypothetical protein K0U98_00140 [Deltaproteobacteria bacterium]|nr:hypothetical protein [Deltaproteobacteria bacterium]